MAAFWDQNGGAFVTWLKTLAGLSAVGSRIFNGPAKSGIDTPYICYAVSGGDNPLHHGGQAALRRVAAQVYAIADTQSQARALAEVIQDGVLAVSKQYLGITWIDFITADVPIETEYSPIDASDQYLRAAQVTLSLVMTN